eukprot:TRINITY_DN5934_c0_g1_i1.p1 TRINITY_DN5934_c0_g1~~TRINITY_DN5934_c0_g1_i1.p1  ORF type:complete len:430 (+),score=25.70 TRINITY_DN5934_c0_g1_i1:3-1292(+)
MLSKLVWHSACRDPRILFDQQVRRWFVFIWGIPGVNTRFPDDLSFQLLAVSYTSNPLAGFTYYKYNTDLTDTGSLHATAGPCPCYGDYQMVGYDNYAIYISANAFALAGDQPYVGSQIHVINKLDLLFGRDLPYALHYDGKASSQGFITQGPPGFKGGNLTTGFAYGVQPAFAPQAAGGSIFGLGGVQYFLSVFMDNVSDTRVELWAMANTSVFSKRSVAVSFTQCTITLPALYVQPSPAPQLGNAATSRLVSLDTGDGGMMQVVYGNGLVWGAWTTQVFDKTSRRSVTGIYWVALSPYFDKHDRVKATIKGTGIIIVPGLWAFYPAITVNAKRAVIVFGLSGIKTRPSVGYCYIALPSFSVSDVHVAVTSSDTYYGYAPKGSRVARWGDYSSAVTDVDGSFWVAAETSLYYSPVQSDNWGTFVAQLPA